eukprot:TRINITY_DN388_c6_g1_i1.p1 TRINITY_DN388_c6_g1~~TRINITY_DN388_c6_g1_i1.p1  ORF type:complete len:455 (-),score=140.01 TRINITY_DN388_c6_g1_i1:167-1531(-)
MNYILEQIAVSDIDLKTASYIGAAVGLGLAVVWNDSSTRTTDKPSVSDKIDGIKIVQNNVPSATDGTNDLDVIESKARKSGQIMANEMPICGLKEVFISSPSSKGHVLSNSPAGQRYRVRDLISEIESKKEQIKLLEQELRNIDIELHTKMTEISFLQKQLTAEKELRSQAEKKSDLMQVELHRLHRLSSAHNIEKDSLQKRYNQLKNELELVKSDKPHSESTKLIQSLFGEMKKEYEMTKTEAVKLRETNKILQQKNAHEKQQREHLLREINLLKKSLSELTLESVLEERSRSEESKQSFDIINDRYNNNNNNNISDINEVDVNDVPSNDDTTVNYNDGDDDVDHNLYGARGRRMYNHVVDNDDNNNNDVVVVDDEVSTKTSLPQKSNFEEDDDPTNFSKRYSLFAVKSLHWRTRSKNQYQQSDELNDDNVSLNDEDYFIALNEFRKLYEKQS